MNRIITNQLKEKLHWPDTDSCKRRMLFINVLHLGWRTQANLIAPWTDRHAEIDAIHLNLERPFWLRLLGRPIGRRGLGLHLWRYFKLSSVWFRQILKRVAIEQTDLLHIMPHSFAGGLHWLKRTYPDLKTAILLDQTGILEVKTFGRSGLVHRIAIAAERRIFDQADVVGVCSQWAADSVVRDYGQSPHKIVVAPPSIEFPSAQAKHQPMNGRLCKIVFVGNDWRRKGGPELLSLHQKYWSKVAELHVISARAPVDNRAQNVIWHGAQPHQRVINELMPSMDFLVLMTREDTFGLVIEEAAAVGLPVVATKIAGIPEIVSDGLTGFLVPPNDWKHFQKAVERLISDTALRVNMGKAAREHIRRNFDPRQNYNKYLQALCDVCRARKIIETSA